MQVSLRGLVAIFVLAAVLPLGCGSGEPDGSTDLNLVEERQVKDLVRIFIMREQGDDPVWKIPPRGGHELSGVFSELYSPEVNDDGTYTVCVDVEDGDNLYDVDFIVRGGGAGFEIADHYLHKVNGQVVE